MPKVLRTLLKALRNEPEDLQRSFQLFLSLARNMKQEMISEHDGGGGECSWLERTFCKDTDGQGPEGRAAVARGLLSWGP